MILFIDGAECIIDDDDYLKIGHLCWHRHKQKRAMAMGKYYFLHSFPRVNHGNPRVVYMHRYIMNQTTNNGMQVDHINGNTLDNRKCNLRVCTQLGNSQNSTKKYTNTSGYKGVHWDRENNKWRASIQANKISYKLGRFENIEDAYAAYCEASRKYHGEFGRVV